MNKVKLSIGWIIGVILVSHLLLQGYLLIFNGINEVINQVNLSNFFTWHVTTQLLEVLLGLFMIVWLIIASFMEISNLRNKLKSSK